MQFKVDTGSKTITISSPISIEEFKKLLIDFNITDEWSIVSDYQYTTWTYPFTPYPYTIPYVEYNKFIVTCDANTITSINSPWNQCTTDTASGMWVKDLPKGEEIIIPQKFEKEMD